MQESPNTALVESTNDCTKQDQDMLQYLTFTVEDEEYGVDIMTVREIKGWSETTRLPNSSEYMRGVMNLRGLIIPIFDLRARFGRGITEPHPKKVVVILAAGKKTIGILVDNVSDILDTNSESIKPAPDTDNSLSQEFVEGLISVKERMVVLLNINKLFGEEIINKEIQATS
ncbi:MAG: chemotaxis protein CheW [Alphaproteobacteria bacterium]